jgi:hypothetical protein
MTRGNRNDLTAVHPRACRVIHRHVGPTERASAAIRVMQKIHEQEQEHADGLNDLLGN